MINHSTIGRLFALPMSEAYGNEQLGSRKGSWHLTIGSARTVNDTLQFVSDRLLWDASCNGQRLADRSFLGLIGRVSA